MSQIKANWVKIPQSAKGRYLKSNLSELLIWHFSYFLYVAITWYPAGIQPCCVHVYLGNSWCLSVSAMQNTIKICSFWMNQAIYLNGHKGTHNKPQNNYRIQQWEQQSTSQQHNHCLSTDSKTCLWIILKWYSSVASLHPITVQWPSLDCIIAMPPIKHTRIYLVYVADQGGLLLNVRYCGHQWLNKFYLGLCDIMVCIIWGHVSEC